MLRTIIGGLSALLLTAGTASADAVRGTVKKVDGARIVVTVDDKETTYDVAKDVKVTRTVRVKKETTTEDVADGLAGVKEGAEAKLTVEKTDGKETVTKIELAAAKKKKKKNK
jgi:hypothetical protein